MLANVNTPGYARETVALQTGVTAGRVNGVVVGEPGRVADKFLEATVYGRSGDAGRAEVEAGYLDRLQSLLGATGSESALPARLDAIAATATAMAGANGGSAVTAPFVGMVEDAIGSMRQLGRDVDVLRGDIEGEVGDTVERVNALLRTVDTLNDSISRLQGLGRSASGPADRRTTALEELSALIGITAREQPSGRVTIDTASGVPLLDQRLRQLSYPASGVGSAQPVYPTIDVRFAEADGTLGAATGTTLDTPAMGGRLGGLLDLRDRQLPAFSARVETLFAGLARTINAASNTGSAVPPPATLTGRATALTGGDRLGFTGAALIAVTRSDGTMVAGTTLDFDALGAAATVDDAIAAINTGLGGAATASFANGTLTIAATGAGTGVAIAQDTARPSARAGIGLSHYFGLNDIVRSDTSMLVPSGFTTADPHRFAAGEAVDFALRDSSGRLVARYALTGATGPSYGDLIDELNASPLGGYGQFALDDAGRLRFSATRAESGAMLSVLSDTTDRGGTGRGFAAITGLGAAGAGLDSAGVRRDVLADPTRLPLARLQPVAVGAKALGPSDRRGATALVDALASAVDLGDAGTMTIARFSAVVLGDAGSAASRATDRADQMGARRDDAINRRDSVSGVNIDEELGQMVVLQNSYAAAARVMTTASEMYETLLGMIR
ncbi:FlgK family flagellar hook-associated protein [Sphingomonas sp. BK481]|uniref:FlgK family flagellar hook-associated protein n=1 Tax=Sphingomonas sp. BK481 TaxID=2586981 RepID=UPI001617E8CF|nr:flagellar basal body rod C-terminal domain-containing protein [Sphingomonas sp. BK481]MBB3587929.1 flagellar hook-associated protein 1 FlgK [Sphingomonas sp. BK481]